MRRCDAFKLFPQSGINHLHCLFWIRLSSLRVIHSEKNEAAAWRQRFRNPCNYIPTARLEGLRTPLRVVIVMAVRRLRISVTLRNWTVLVIQSSWVGRQMLENNCRG